MGTTGTGKSTLAAWLLEQRRYVVVFRSKPDDVRYAGTRTVRTADALDDLRHTRLVLAPKYDEQYSEFRGALERIWRQGGWTVYLDELLYLDRLKLRLPIERLLTQGRSKGITVIVGMQRPAQVTRFALSESMHVLTFGLEGRDAREIGYATASWVRDAVEGLGRHEIAWFARPNRLWVGKLNLRARALEGVSVRA